MSDLAERIRRLTDTPAVDVNHVTRPDPPSRVEGAAESTHKAGGPGAHLAIVAVSVAAVLATVIVLTYPHSSSYKTTVTDGAAFRPSGPAVERTATYHGDAASLSIPHSRYPAGSRVTAALTIRLPATARPQVIRRVCQDQVFQLVVSPVFSVVTPGWNRAHCAGSVTIGGGVARFRVAARMPVAPGPYQVALHARDFDGVGPLPLPVDVVANTAPTAVPPVTTTIRLNQTRIVTGRPIHGTVTFTNHTRRAVTVQDCPEDGWLQAGLANGTIGVQPGFDPLVGCPWTVKLRPGPTVEKVTIRTRFASCGVGLPSGPCDGDTFPAVPPGRYETGLWVTGLPASTQLPRPVTVTLLPAGTSGT